MLSLIMNKREAISQLISDHVQNVPHSFQLQGEIGLVKFVEEDVQSHKKHYLSTQACTICTSEG